MPEALKDYIKNDDIREIFKGEYQSNEEEIKLRNNQDEWYKKATGRK